PPAPLRSRVALCMAALLVAFVARGGTAPRAAAATDETEPIPPVLFFAFPDLVETKKQIDELIDGSFADTTKAVRAREILVRRFGLWSVPSLLERVAAPTNVPQAWNSELAIASLRRTYGPSYLLWPTIRPLVKNLESQGTDPFVRAVAALAPGR